jgi:hypothetical protein
VPALSRESSFWEKRRIMCDASLGFGRTSSLSPPGLFPSASVGWYDLAKAS